MELVGRKKKWLLMGEGRVLAREGRMKVERGKKLTWWGGETGDL